MDESLNQYRRRYIKFLHEQLDGQIIIFGGRGFSRAGKLVAFALKNNIPILLHPHPTVIDAFDDLRKRVEQLKVEIEQLNSKGRIFADDLRVQLHKPGSRRGRNIKPDESRKARYSEPKSRQ